MSFFFAPSSATETVATIDSFEDGSMSEWYGAGAGSLASAVTKSFAKDGSYVCELTAGDRCSSASGGSNSGGLPNYPVKGVEFEYYVYFEDTDSNINCYWCFPPTEDHQPWENSFEYRLSPSQSSTELESNHSSSGDVSYATTTHTFATGQWYQVDVDYFYTSSTDVTVELYDGTGTKIATDTASPASTYIWDNPSIAFLGGDGVTGYVDHVNIVNQ